MMLHRQFICYAIIGLLLNATLYTTYLVLTYAGLPSIIAMTITYVTGVLSGFLLNRRITFRHQQVGSGALMRYVAAYGIGYAINFIILWLFVVRWGAPHQLVQGCVTLGLPVLLFALQRLWVFAPHRSVALHTS
jgi:putative flippase GtrA